MKLKIYASISALVLTSALFSCQQQAPKTEEAAQLPVAALQAPYSQVWYDSLNQVMTAYYSLSAAMVKADTAGATVAGQALKQHVDSLPYIQLQMDSAHLANLSGIGGSISAELVGLQGETGIEGKRESFQMVSDMLFDLVKATGFKGHTVYRQFCPMAFDDKGAYWLSETRKITNPYFGAKMLDCGSTNDSLIYK
ncbi:uncharacterized protein DUF3347 [Chitinophaga dinghuensis]|uniref:Uncharacterized protein DUF3347 n=1 Tax=Chitinophaga dinghuensis TaxID=1539050 RepID=A0A327VV99_9BACT|nr:DUF3347 domain-containing protein [Chitinophaga dinghuensis]RAJ79907.1 uncharacterized protein DUF3347 [Chitinophaga dinghuensis]